MRHTDWPERLANLIEARRTLAFAWGENDCAAFAAAAIDAVAGRAVDLPAHASEFEALRQIATHGSLVAATALVLGEPVAPGLARRGDVVVVPNEGREVLAVCLGLTCAAPGPDGLTFVPAALAVACWRID